jgi:hypothetical protein
MMVRHMPDDDFMQLCNRVMNTAKPSEGFTLDTARSGAVGRGGALSCDVCGRPAEAEILNEMGRALGGTCACKACLIQAIALLFDGNPEAVALGEHVLRLAAAGPAQ